MNKLVINNFEEFEQYVGKELGVSDYMQITQEQIKLIDTALPLESNYRGKQCKDACKLRY